MLFYYSFDSTSESNFFKGAMLRIVYQVDLSTDIFIESLTGIFVKVEQFERRIWLLFKRIRNTKSNDGQGKRHFDAENLLCLIQ
ncbi:MAG TPA: hypothetical protein VL947_10260 [Cytophagales bacterium]|nr:hypothetical protein [Cytophagales bacterium]